MTRRQTLGELPLGMQQHRRPREHAGRLHAIAPERCVAPVHHPAPADRYVLEESQHHFLMVAHQRHYLEARRSIVQHHVDDSARGWAAVDVVAEIDEPLGDVGMALGIGLDLLKERLQQIGSPVDVSDGIEPAPGGSGG